MIDDRSLDHTPHQAHTRLLGDIGGTNARFGVQRHAGAPITHVQVLACADHASLHDAVRHYLKSSGVTLPTVAAFGMANPVTSDQVVMTNHDWRFSIRELRQQLGLQRLVVMNDFTALALALRHIPAEELRQVGGALAKPQAPIALLGAGTGLGVSGLLPNGAGAWLPLSGEGGHVSLAAQTTLEVQVIQSLQQRFGHVSAERVLSGQGLVNVYLVLHALSGAPNPPVLQSAAEVLQRDQSDPMATQTIDVFCALLGAVAGDLALTLGAQGGVFIGGGIVPRLAPGRFDRSDFRKRFEAKGRFASYLQPIPVWVIDSPVSPALLGASQALG